MNKPSDEQIDEAFEKALGDTSHDKLEQTVKDMMVNFVDEMKQTFREAYRQGWDDAINSKE